MNIELAGGPAFVRFWLPLLVTDEHGPVKTEKLHLRVHQHLVVHRVGGVVIETDKSAIEFWLEVGFVDEFPQGYISETIIDND